VIELNWISSLREELDRRTPGDPERFIEALQGMAETGSVPAELTVKTADNRIADVEHESSLFDGRKTA